MNEFSNGFGSGQEPDPELIRRFFEQTLGQQLPEGMLESLDLSGLAGMAGLPSDPAALQAMAMQMQAMFKAGEGKPVNWDLVRDTARKILLSKGDPVPGHNQVNRYQDALRVADMWVRPHTDLDAAPTNPRAWSRSEWVEATLPRWSRMIEPVAENIVRAMGDAMTAQMSDQFGEDNDPSSLGFNPNSMINQLGGTMMGAQFGHALATLASEVLTGSEVGVPLLEPRITSLVINNLNAFAKDLALDESEAVHYLAAREVARAVLFNSVPWLSGHIVGAVEAYARTIEIDMSAMTEYVRDMDVSDMANLDNLPQNMFAVQKSPAQESSLKRLGTALALVEGWVEVVSEDAVRGKLPNLDVLQETMRRRRATGGPAEHLFAALCGLELRPRALREAAQYWRDLGANGDYASRDKVWGHPDLLPEAEDLALHSIAPANPSDTSAVNESSSGDAGAAIGGSIVAVSPGAVDNAPSLKRPAITEDQAATAGQVSEQTTGQAKKQAATTGQATAKERVSTTDEDADHAATNRATKSSAVDADASSHQITRESVNDATVAETAPASNDPFDGDFDAALAALLRGEGDELAPKEDGKGGIVTPDVPDSPTNATKKTGPADNTPDGAADDSDPTQPNHGK